MKAMTTVAIITIVSIVIIVALAVAGLYVWGENVNLRRENSALILVKGKASQDAFAGAKKIQAELDNARERLAKFDRIRGEGGKFVRPDGTYTPYDTEEPEASDVQSEDVEDEYIPSGMRDLDTDMMP